MNGAGFAGRRRKHVGAVKCFRKSINFGYIEVCGISPNLTPYAIEVPASWAGVLCLRRSGRYRSETYRASIAKARAASPRGKRLNGSQVEETSA